MRLLVRVLLTGFRLSPCVKVPGKFYNIFSKIIPIYYYLHFDLYFGYDDDLRNKRKKQNIKKHAKTAGLYSRNRHGIFVFMRLALLVDGWMDGWMELTNSLCTGVIGCPFSVSDSLKSNLLLEIMNTG